MPRIELATIAEHRAHQRASLLAAARELFEAGGVAAVTPKSVGARAGLARSSVYEYFPSSAALLAAVAEDQFPQWAKALEDAVAARRTPLTTVDAYNSATLAQVAAGEHRLGQALETADLPAETRARLRALHDELVAPLERSLRELGRADHAMVAALVSGALNAAVRMVQAGAPSATVERVTRAFVRAAIS
jgi:AcrR family transcriptional regulator